jgi:hypothetical protein
MTPQECDFAGPLLQLRSICEEVDVDCVRDETNGGRAAGAQGVCCGLFVEQSIVRAPRTRPVDH